MGCFLEKKKKTWIEAIKKTWKEVKVSMREYQVRLMSDFVFVQYLVAHSCSLFPIIYRTIHSLL